MLCQHFDISGAGLDAEMHGFDAGFTYAATRDRSLLSTMNQRKFGVWLGFEHGDVSLPEAAAREWEGLFQHKSLARDPRYKMDYHRPLDLVRQRLMLLAEISVT